MRLKTIVISLLLVGTGFCCAQAQNKNVNKAEDDLKSGKLDEAKQMIDQASVNEKTSDKAKTWYLKGEVYAAIAKKDSTHTIKPDPKIAAFQAFQKCLQLDPKYPSMLLTNYKPLSDLYVDFWKDGANAFNAKDYANAFQAFKHVKTVNDYLFGLGLGMGSKIDTMAILNIGNAAYNLGQKDTASKYYQQLADINYKKEAFVYKVLLAQYRDKDSTKYLAVLAKAKSLFPNDKDFANEEISYYNEKGDMGQLVKKLEEEVAKDPSDYNGVLNLAITYDNMANPKTDSGTTADLPPNHDSLFSKAVSYYKKAITLKPDGYAANFNLGLMYYNSAAHLGKQLGKLTTSKADQAKQDTLIKKQTALLDGATPYLEKAFQSLDAKSKLDPSELAAYKNAIIGLEGVYARQNKMDKYNELKKKLEAADTKAQ
ncbi:MAG TPA: hypothetical protein VFX43_06210 [Chitinophagaceae bacterium]|jgi:hypothetical protein|nr:hypothetical protein [Chitinophagaceae bacterium]